MIKLDKQKSVNTSKIKLIKSYPIEDIEFGACFDKCEYEDLMQEIEGS